MAPLRTDKRGSMLLEALLSGALLGIFVVGVVGAILAGQEAAVTAGKRAEAIFLADEALQAVRNMRDNSFSSLTDGTHGLSGGSTWSFSGASDTVNVFTRQTAISTVSADTKSVTSTVTWQQTPTRTGSVSLTSLLGNWMRTKSVAASWATPALLATLDLAGNSDGVKIAYANGYVYIIRAASSNNFVVVDVMTPSAPALTATISITGTPSDIAVSGNYAYIASNSNSGELQVVDITTPSSPSVVGTYNASGNTNGISVAVSGSYAYLGRAASGSTREFEIVSVATPSSPVGVGTLETGAQINGIVISGTTAYLASADNSAELTVVNVAVPASPAVLGSYNASGNTDASAVALSGSLITLGRTSGDILLINVSLPAAPSLYATYSSSSSIDDLALNGSTLAFAATPNATAEFKVINESTPTAPVLFGSLDTVGALTGLVYDQTNDLVYAVSTDNAGEFVIFHPL